MSTKLRAFTGALILCLIVVPAVVRATRTFDPGPRPRLAPSFNKSFDVPPDVAAIAPDVTAAPALRLVGPAQPPVGTAAVVDSRYLVHQLRGPPALVRS
jgi:hypothetical protein